VQTKFKVGDRVRVAVTDYDKDGWGKQSGDVGTVSRVYAGSFFPVEVTFDQPAHASTNLYEHSDLMSLTKVPSAADDLRLTPQAKTVLRHLKHHGRITPMKAMVNYSITRLSSCIHEIRKVGYDVKTEVQSDDAGHKFANYTMPATVH
jgi:hypothetical protein